MKHLPLWTHRPKKGLLLSLLGEHRAAVVLLARPCTGRAAGITSSRAHISPRAWGCPQPPAHTGGDWNARKAPARAHRVRQSCTSVLDRAQLEQCKGSSCCACNCDPLTSAAHLLEELKPFTSCLTVKRAPLSSNLQLSSLGQHTKSHLIQLSSNALA